MSTKTLVDRLMRKAGSGWSRPGILKLIEQGQDALYSVIQNGRKWRGPDNKGLPPFLLTTDNEYRYEINAANLSCDEISIPIRGVNYLVQPDVVIGVFSDVRNYDGYGVGGPSKCIKLSEDLDVYPIAVDSTPAYESTNPSVTFISNPGTTTNKYYVDFIYKAPRLLSEQIPLAVPEEFEKALEEYVVGEIQAEESGSPSIWQDKFDRIRKPEFRRAMSSGVKSHDHRTQLRIC